MRLGLSYSEDSFGGMPGHFPYFERKLNENLSSLSDYKSLAEHVSRNYADVVDVCDWSMVLALPCYHDPLFTSGG